MDVTMLDLAKHHEPLRAEILAAMTRVFDAGQYIAGPDVEAFERELAAELGVGHVVGVSSGTDALILALMALGIGPGDDVVTTPCSFVATSEAIVRAGARPIFADIEADSHNLDPLLAAHACTSRTRAIIPVHLFGRRAATPVFDTIPVIEDAAQAIGAAPLRGIAGCLSFFPSKNLGACGDAGAVYTHDRDLADAVRLRRNHGTDRRYHYSVTGGNMRLDSMQAAILRVKLPHLVDWTTARQRNAARYREMFATTSAPVELPGHIADHVYNQFVIRAPNRDYLRPYLAERGVSTDVYYPTPLHLQPCFAHLGYGPGDFPVAEQAAREVLGLPIYPELTADQQWHVVRQIEEFYR